MYAVFDKTYNLFKQAKMKIYGSVTFHGELPVVGDPVANVTMVTEVDGWMLHELIIDPRYESHDVDEIHGVHLDTSCAEWEPVVRAKSACREIIGILKVCCCFKLLSLIFFNVAHA